MSRAAELQDDTLAAMLAVVDPDWSVMTSRPSDAGHNPVAHVTVETPDGVQELVVKACAETEVGVDATGLVTEATLLAIVGDHTDLPVPVVHALIKSGTDLPTPFIVMDAAAGTQVRKRDVGTLSDDAIVRLSRESGQVLAELHRVPAPDGFGRILVDETESSIDGLRPVAAPGQLTVSGIADESPSADWPTILEDWVDQALAGLAESRFADRKPEIRAELETRTDAVRGPFESVIARIDHGLHNLTCDPETGALTGVFDWGFTLATPPAYDVACVLANLTRDPWAVHPSTPDRSDLVRRAFLDGYAANGDRAVLEQYHANRECYDLLCLTRAMVHLEMAMEDGDPGDHNAAANQYRALLADHL